MSRATVHTAEVGERFKSLAMWDVLFENDRVVRIYMHEDGRLWARDAHGADVAALSPVSGRANLRTPAEIAMMCMQVAAAPARTAEAA
jgi:hypothetical protein